MCKEYFCEKCTEKILHLYVKNVSTVKQLDDV